MASGGRLQGSTSESLVVIYSLTMHTKVLLFIVSMIVVFSACEKATPASYQAEASSPDHYHACMKELTDVIVHNIFSPPVASRCYAYPNIAAYEVMVSANPGYQSLAGQLNELQAVPAPPKAEIDHYLASLEAFMVVAQALTFSDVEMEEFREKIYADYKAMGMGSGIMEHSRNYGETVANHILAWAGGDNYAQTRTSPAFDVIADEAGRWKPTPPEYMEAIEPSWSTIRTFVLDSAQQFIPPPPTPFDLDKKSLFWKELTEVYDAVNDASKEDSAIAQFWDCNPYVGHVVGHVRYATKKITPGGHWMGIAGIAAQKSGSDFVATIESYTLTSIALADAFISCWDEKYRSNLIRPETVINEHHDPEWRPLLQTPPFPEYTSGHSVISRAAAVALSKLYGETFPYVDTVEVEYGLPPRSYESFFQASDEAAVSRLYGGIHYRPACDLGVEQGRKVGEFIIKNIDMRREREGLADK